MPFSYWMPAMPRIRDKFLNCVVYLYPSEPDAESGEQAGGSGFLLAIQDFEKNVQINYVVTNRHVVQDGSSVIRLNSTSGKKMVLEIDERAWRFHPDGDDVAVAMIGLPWKELNFSVVTPEMFLTKELSKKYNIGPGDECFLVGRFINHEGRQQNLPTTRFGSLAQMPHEPIIQNDGFLQESYLVEVKAIGGYSGSPVFVQIPFGSERENVENWSVSPDHPSDAPPFSIDFASLGVFNAHGPWLMGVDWGYINEWRAVCNSKGSPVNPARPDEMQVSLNTGMMAVVPAWKIQELLDAPEVAAERRAATIQTLNIRAMRAQTITEKA